MTQLWEILVPTVHNEPKRNGDPRPYRKRHHQVWDAKVREISGGLTIIPPVRGQWVSGNTVYSERMIPVRIIATKEQMDEIVQFTFKHYPDQLAILMYLVSNEAYVVNR